jgi:tryptophan 2,3-dioxygenase
MAHRDEFTKPILPGKGATDYERYLRTDELLALQKSSEVLLHKDEMTFLVVHQSSELLMKGAAFELDAPDPACDLSARTSHRPAAHPGDH